MALDRCCTYLGRPNGCDLGNSSARGRWITRPLAKVNLRPSAHAAPHSSAYELPFCLVNMK